MLIMLNTDPINITSLLALATKYLWIKHFWNKVATKVPSQMTFS